MQRDKYGDNQQQKESDGQANPVWVRLEIFRNGHSTSARMSYQVLFNNFDDIVVQFP